MLDRRRFAALGLSGLTTIAVAESAVAQQSHQPPAGDTPATNHTTWFATEVDLSQVEGIPAMLSPDGARILTIDESNHTMTVTDIETSETWPNQDNTFFGEASSPMAWSPDGSAIAFIATPFKESDLSVWEPETGILTLLTDDGSSDRAEPSDTPIYTDYAPMWSADSQSIAYFRYVENQENSSVSILTIDRDGEDGGLLAREVTTREHPDVGRKIRLADESIVYSVTAYESSPPSDLPGIWRLPAGGGSPVKLDFDAVLPGLQLPILIDATLIDGDLAVLVYEYIAFDVSVPTHCVVFSDPPQVISAADLDVPTDTHAAFMKFSPDGAFALTYTWSADEWTATACHLATGTLSESFVTRDPVTDYLISWYQVQWLASNRVYLSPVGGFSTDDTPIVLDLAPVP